MIFWIYLVPYKKYPRWLHLWLLSLANIAALEIFTRPIIASVKLGWVHFVGVVKKNVLKAITQLTALLEMFATILRGSVVVRCSCIFVITTFLFYIKDMIESIRNTLYQIFKKMKRILVKRFDTNEDDDSSKEIFSTVNIERFEEIETENIQSSTVSGLVSVLLSN